jgi:hypothetical protein
MGEVVERVDWTHAPWRRSTRCVLADTACVEVTVCGNVIGMRHSKDPAGPVLAFSTGQWRDFIAGLKEGDFD